MSTRFQSPSELRTKVLAAALSTLLQYGTRGIRSANLAKAANTSESTMFRHFGDVEGIIQELYEECWEQINAYLYDEGFQDPFTGDPVDRLVREFDRLWRMRDRDDLHGPATIAFTFFRRPHELGIDFESQNQRKFERRIETLCEHASGRTRDPTISPRTIRQVLINYAATIWLTWELMPQGESDLSADEARLGLLGLLDRLVPVTA